MEHHLGCGQLNDDEFLRAFETCELKHGMFYHADHVRLAWIYVRRFGAAGAEERLLAGIRKMANHAGAPRKFLFTTTVAWARLVAGTQKDSGVSETFLEWAQRHPELLEKNLLAKYYSPGRLETPEARSGWVEPDLAPLDER